MRIVELSVEYEAYYSGAEYSENMYLLEDDYLKLEEDFDGKEVYLGELDGKHSESTCEIYIDYIDEEQQANRTYPIFMDGDCMFNEICEYTSQKTLWEMRDRANKYIDDLDAYVEVEVKVRKSKINELNEFVNNLDN